MFYLNLWRENIYGTRQSRLLNAILDSSLEPFFVIETRVVRTFTAESRKVISQELIEETWQSAIMR